MSTTADPHDTSLSPSPTGRIVVVGGANLDVFGFSAKGVVAQDSNPGHIEDSPGGVARNVAENLARLGVDTHLVTAFGSDASGLRLALGCRADGIAIDASLTVEHVPGSRYVAILDDEGDLVVAVSDMRALDSLTPAFLTARRRLLDSADLVVADTNLPAETLLWLSRESMAPLLVDTVSTVKALRATAALPGVHTLKLNALEAGALLSREVDRASDAEVESATQDLMSLGVRRVFITLGRHGVFARDSQGGVRLRAPEVAVVNATGAGDAFCAGVARATIAGMTLAETAAFGLAMSAVALSSERTVSESIDPEKVASAMKELLS
jgi:pseudouridine kinase